MSAAFRLDGRRALVTGANAGIGRAVAIGLAEAGAHVVAAGRRSCTETVAAIEAAGGSAEALVLDVTDRDAGDALPGGLDVLVNNAGIIRRADALDTGDDDWDAVVATNLTAVFRLSRAFARAAVARGGAGQGAGGRIVTIASLLSFQGGIRVPAYAAAKHGVAGLTKALANEWAAHGITVNAVAPGYVATANTEALRADPERAAAILARIPMGRWAEPEDIAGAVTFLASPAAAYVTGTVLAVDGGWLAR